MMLRIKDYLDIVYDNLTTREWDNCIVISGDEGRGKSTLALHLIDYWYTKLKGSCNAEDVKHVCLTRLEWAADLKDMTKYECTVYDEAGDINSRRSMSGFNTDVMEAYQIIRADCLFTVLVLPSIFDLDSFFRKRRIRHLFHVYQRGRVAFWSRDRLRKMLERNESYPIKNMFVVNPTFYDTYPKYKGPMLQPYLDKKAEKMKLVRKNFYERMKEAPKTNPCFKRDELIKKMSKKFSNAELASMTGLSESRVRGITNSKLSA